MTTWNAVVIGFILELIELNRQQGRIGREMMMNHKTCLTRAVIAALALTAAVGIAGCGRSGHQAEATNANLTMATPAATAALPPTGAMTQEPAPPPQAIAPPATAAPAPTPAAPQPAPSPRFAQVVAVKPITQTTTASTPRQVCNDEQVQVPETYKDKHQLGGTILGAAGGYLLGSQIGDGKGKTAAKIVTTAGGAYLGKEIQKHHQQNNATRTETQNVCRTVTDKSTKTTTVGYTVTYKLNGKTGTVRMDHNPGVGTGLPVQNGVVVASGSKGGSYYK